MNRVHGAARIFEMNDAEASAALDNLGHRAQVVAAYFPHRGAILRAPFEVAGLMMQHVKGFAVTIDNVEDRAHHFDQLAARVADGAIANSREHLDQLRDHRLGNERNNLVLAVEVEVDRPSRQPSLECELFDGSLMKRLA